MIVEYSSPNIAKPFTIGHLRSTIIGDAIANLNQAIGFTVYRDNHVGDWGTQFGKQIYAIKQWGLIKDLEASDRPIKLLVDLYVKFHNETKDHPELEDEARLWFKKLESGDSEARELWNKCIAWSWSEFSTIYDELGVRFTENSGRGYGESFFEDKIEPIIGELEAKKLLTTSDGARLIFFDNEKFPPLMIQKKDGTTLYATRDLATDKFRIEKYGAHCTIVNEVGAEQSLYFQQLYEVERMLGWFKKEQRVHVKHGMYRFKDSKMSTRSGNVVWLEDVIKESIAHARKLSPNSNAKTVHDMAIGALKWNDLKRSAQQDIIFDWDDVLNMQGNSGPYLQYAYARTRSILEKIDFKPNSTISLPETLTDEEYGLLRIIPQFREVVETSAINFTPHVLCNYLYLLTQKFNHFYEKNPILKSSKDSRQLRLALVSATGHVINHGLSLLGIETPEKL